jgi:glutathione S-transferase
MANMTLYHAAPSRSSIALCMLEEIGEPYDIELLSLKKGDNRAPAYLDVNPMGKVPALKHGNVVITEVAAICCYLADEFPRAGLNVPVGHASAGPISNGCSSAPVCSRQRSWTARFRAAASRRARPSAMAISTPP